MNESKDKESSHSSDDCVIIGEEESDSLPPTRPSTPIDSFDMDPEISNLPPLLEQFPLLKAETSSSEESHLEIAEACEVKPEDLETPSLSPIPSSADSLKKDVLMEEDEACSKKTLPYFQLPNPNLDDYLMATDKVLTSGEKRFSSSCTKKFVEDQSLIKDKGVHDEYLNPSDDISCTLKSTSNITGVSASAEYSNVISCLGQLDERASPGIKRSVFKEFLKRKINEKKATAFNKSKDLSAENEESSRSVKNLQSDGEEEISSSDGEEETSNESSENEYVQVSPNPTLSYAQDTENSSESEEELFQPIKKRAKILNLSDEESNDSSSCNVVASTDSRFDLKESLDNFQDLNESGNNMQEIPSYQPFMTEEDTKESNDEARTLLANERTLNCSENISHSVLPILPMDDPPLNDGIFLSQDLASLCSGPFKSKKDIDETFACGLEKDNINETELEENEWKEEIFENKEIKDSGLEENDWKEVNFENEGMSDTEKIDDFLDLEAELSGEDDGEEIPESEDEGSVDNMFVTDPDLPPSPELRDEIAGLHVKQLMDDDEEVLKAYQERYLDDGELHSDGRARKFAWKNNKLDIDDKNKFSSDSEEEGPSDSWSTVDQEKAKWLEENKVKNDEDTDNLNSSCKKVVNKVKILSKPEFCSQDTDVQLSGKRKRGSLLQISDVSTTQILKKLKTEEEVKGGSRTTKHFLFQNEPSSEVFGDKPKPDVYGTSISEDDISIFNEI